MTRILVIEDEAVILENILDLLEAEGFEVYGALNGTEGIRLAKERHPDLIISDVMMPGIDGYDVLETLQNDPATAIIPFIFLSANAALKDIRKGMNLGALDYLTKPFSRIDLLSAVRSRVEIADRVKGLMSERESMIRRQMLREIPDSFSNLLNNVMGSFHAAELENESIVKLFDQLIPKINILIDCSNNDTEIQLFKSILKVLQAAKIGCEEQSKHLSDGLTASGNFYSLLQSLFRSLEKI